MKAKSKVKPVPQPKSLDELMDEAASLWSSEGPSGVYHFTLGKFAHGWQFNVTNSWQRWHAANRQHTFGPFPTPHEAVQAFLTYVAENRIIVSHLQD